MLLVLIDRSVRVLFHRVIHIMGITLWITWRIRVKTYKASVENNISLKTVGFIQAPTDQKTAASDAASNA